jgi:hypothetical protein
VVAAGVDESARWPKVAKRNWLILGVLTFTSFFLLVGDIALSVALPAALLRRPAAASAPSRGEGSGTATPA